MVNDVLSYVALYAQEGAQISEKFLKLTSMIIFIKNKSTIFCRITLHIERFIHKRKVVPFYRAMLCIRSNSRGPVSVCFRPSVTSRCSIETMQESSWFLARELPSTRPTLC